MPITIRLGMTVLGLLGILAFGSVELDAQSIQKKTPEKSGTAVSTSKSRPRPRPRPAQPGVSRDDVVKTAPSGPPLDVVLYDRMSLPESWKSQFWGSTAARSLFAMEPKAIADLVPTQAGVRFCRCPACEASELDDPLIWSPEKPTALVCKRCGVNIPNDKFPAKEKDKPGPPEETVEVVSGIIHHYPYHAVEATKSRYPDERLYLHAKRDYQVRLYLTKAALYAAVKYREQPREARDPKLALVSAVIILRFSQAYPNYATHLDQPGEAKQFQPAGLAPPYRSGYETGKWEWNGSLDVPMNLVLAYALLRDDPAIEAAGKLLGDPNPGRTIEQDFFRASAEFASRQPEEFTEDSLHVYRGMMAVGKLIGDPILLRDAALRLEGFAQRGFYHDGMWRQASLRSHRRVLGILDGWIDRLLVDPGAKAKEPFTLAKNQPDPLLQEMPILALARNAGSAVLSRPEGGEVQQASWPSSNLATRNLRQPRLLGGAGIARLAIGKGEDALDLELRGLDSFGEPHFQRLAMRLAVGGKSLLDDLDELPPTSTGWDLATPSHNTVVIDGLNQRENAANASKPAAGSDILFHAADPDFQVTCFRDPRAYPTSARRYRHSLIASAGARSRYAISIFEVHGGLQHDQFFHAAPGSLQRWATDLRGTRAPSSLLVSTIPFLKNATADQGRWFVQSYGFLDPISQVAVTRPSLVRLEPLSDRSTTEVAKASAIQAAVGASANRLKLHLLGDTPLNLISSVSPDPLAQGFAKETSAFQSTRASLVLRRRSENGATLNSTFVTLFEPTGDAFPPLIRVGRVASDPDSILIYVESTDGPEQILVNLTPGTKRKLTLIDGQILSTDGFVVRIRKEGLVLAGGTFASGLGFDIRQPKIAGTIVNSGQHVSDKGLGWFETLAPLKGLNEVDGRILHLTHGDGTSHTWTLRGIETDETKTKLYVEEEPGFRVDPTSNVASYYQFPRGDVPGPHQFRISTMMR